MVEFDRGGIELFSSPDPLISVLMYSRDRPEVFRESAMSVAQTCSDVSQVEIINKFDDNDPNVPRYLEIANEVHTQFGIHVKTVVSNRLKGYWSIHTYLNDLSLMARGKILWIIGDDIMVQGDWCLLLASTRNKFQDNIYVIHMPGAVGRRVGKIISPALSREWIDALGFVSPHPAADRFLALLASQCGRLFADPKISSGIVLSHNQKTQIPRMPIDLDANKIRLNIDCHVKRLVPVMAEAIRGQST